MSQDEPLEKQIAVRLPLRVVDGLQRHAPAPRLRLAYLAREALIEWLSWKDQAPSVGPMAITPDEALLLDIYRRLPEGKARLALEALRDIVQHPEPVPLLRGHAQRRNRESKGKPRGES